MATGEGAIGQSIVYVEVNPVSGGACSFDADATITITEVDTGSVMEVDGNPASGRISGDLRPGSNLSLAFGWTGCAPGDVRVDATHRVIVQAEVAGYGQAQGVGQTPKCQDPSTGSQLVNMSPVLDLRA